MRPAASAVAVFLSLPLTTRPTTASRPRLLGAPAHTKAPLRRGTDRARHESEGLPSTRAPCTSTTRSRSRKDPPLLSFLGKSVSNQGGSRLQRDEQGATCTARRSEGGLDGRCECPSRRPGSARPAVTGARESGGGPCGIPGVTFEAVARHDRVVDDDDRVGAEQFPRLHQLVGSPPALAGTAGTEVAAALAAPVSANGESYVTGGLLVSTAGVVLLVSVLLWASASRVAIRQAQKWRPSGE